MNLKYFLGANSYGGFASFYDGFVRARRVDRLYILKGGAGCGKSSFMKRLAGAAEEEGMEVERILCSGDPGSLDGIFIPALRLAYVDGTAPQAAVPRMCFAHSEVYQNARGEAPPLLQSPQPCLGLNQMNRGFEV